MLRVTRTLMLVSLFALFLLSPIASGQKKKDSTKKRSITATPTAFLWRQPTHFASRNLFYGAGGRSQQPKGPFIFLKEDTDKSTPKFDIEDANGLKWRVKLGVEAQPEVAASRLVWAVGYFTDVNYYLRTLKVKGLPKLKRGQEFVSNDGTVLGARLELRPRGQKDLGNWDWFENRFSDTAMLNGLKVLMALLNNWDLKKDNNKIYREGNREIRYVVSDLGSSFGKTGDLFSRSKGDVEDYLESKFIKHVDREGVDFHFHSRPPFFLFLNMPYYCERTDMQTIVKNIPTEDARWIGNWLAKLSKQQIADAFYAAGYSPDQTAKYTDKVRLRIADLNRLPPSRLATEQSEIR